MSHVMTVSDAIASHARLQPNRIGTRDSRRSLSFAAWDERATRLANGLLGLGLVKGDRVVLLAWDILPYGSSDAELQLCQLQRSAPLLPSPDRSVDHHRRHLRVGQESSLELLVLDRGGHLADSGRCHLQFRGGLVGPPERRQRPRPSSP